MHPPSPRPPHPQLFQLLLRIVQERLRLLHRGRSSTDLLRLPQVVVQLLPRRRRLARILCRSWRRGNNSTRHTARDQSKPQILHIFQPPTFFVSPPTPPTPPTSPPSPHHPHPP